MYERQRPPAAPFFTKVVDAPGVEADGSFRAMSPELRESLTIGRPIDFRDPEVMMSEPAAVGASGA
ncbi:MAG: hypothetical protein WD448_06715 [Woeseia sp.]